VALPKLRARAAALAVISDPGSAMPPSVGHLPAGARGLVLPTPVRCTCDYEKLSFDYLEQSGVSGISGRNSPTWRFSPLPRRPGFFPRTWPAPRRGPKRCPAAGGAPAVLAGPARPMPPGDGATPATSGRPIACAVRPAKWRPTRPITAWAGPPRYCSGGRPRNLCRSQSLDRGTTPLNSPRGRPAHASPGRPSPAFVTGPGRASAGGLPGSPVAARLARLAGDNRGSGRRGVPQTSGNYSERGCGMPASSARTSVSR